MSKLPKIQRRQIPLFVLLILVLGVWVYTLVDNYMMRRNLDMESRSQVTKVSQDYSSEDGVETVKTVSANREFVLFGPTKGTVTVFFKNPAKEEQFRYSAIEIGFMQQENHWVMTESRGLDRGEVNRIREVFGDPIMEHS